MICSTWRTSSKKLKSHHDGYGPTMAQLSNIVEFRILESKETNGYIFIFLVSYTLINTWNSLSQREQIVVKLYFNHIINQHSSNEAHCNSTDCNSHLDTNGNQAGESHRSTVMLGEWLVRSCLPLNPGERQEVVNRPTSPQQRYGFQSR